jgi:hypothetical protein
LLRLNDEERNNILIPYESVYLVSLIVARRFTNVDNRNQWFGSGLRRWPQYIYAVESAFFDGAAEDVPVAGSRLHLPFPFVQEVRRVIVAKLIK